MSAWVVGGVGKTNLVRSRKLVDVQFSISAILILRRLFVTLHKLWICVGIRECSTFGGEILCPFWVTFAEQSLTNVWWDLGLLVIVAWWFKSVLKYVVKYRLIVINFRVFGSVVLSAKCGGQSSFCLAMPSPTLRPREQADLARYRSFIWIIVGSVYDVTGSVTARPVTAALGCLRVGQQLTLSEIRGYDKKIHSN